MAEKIAAMLAKDPRIEVVEPNRLREPLAIANDPKYSSEWGLKIVNAPRAWSFTPGRFATASAPLHSRPLIAVVDTGVDCTHPDFVNAGGTSKDAALGGQLSFAKSKTYVNTTVSPAACAWQDDYGHGTHVAGTIAAATSNGIGVTGLAYGAVIAAYKTSNSSGMSSDYAICQAIMAAADAGATVISISLGGPGYSQTMQDAVEYAWQRNALVVAAAGNANTNKVYFPGAATHAIAVAAVDGNRARASFSNYGDFIGIAAPGVGVISTAPTYTNKMGVKDYASMSGTSMATPHVSGAAGLLVMAYPGARMTAVAARLQQTASSSKATGGWDQYLGYGVLDAGAATTGTLRPASVGGITGQVTNTTNTPIYAAVVSAGGASFTTGPDGLFHLGNLPEGVRQVTVSATGFPVMSFGVTVPAGADVVVTAQLGATMGSYTGYVSSGGAGLAGAVVEAVSGGLVQASVITAADGSFTLPIVAGAYDLRASALGYISGTATAVAAHAGGPASVDFTLSRLGNIAGTVTDAGGAPKPNVQIQVSNATFEAGAITDANGQFATLGLPAGTYKVTAEATGFDEVVVPGVSVTPDTTENVSLTLAAGLASVTVSSASATGPATVSNNTITLNGAAPEGGAVVALSSSSPSATVPATVVVPAGATSATFAVQLSAVATSTPVTISASWSNSTKTATLTDLRPVMSFMYVATTAVKPGGSTTATAYITGVAPAGGATLALSASSSSVTLPASVIVPVGKNSVSFAVSVASTASAGTATISGSYGAVTKSGTLNIAAGSATLSSVTISPASLVGGSSSAASSVALGAAAPAGGAVVSLTSSSPSVIVPASVTIAAGATSATFSISTNVVSSSTAATITATYATISKTGTLTVAPPAPSSALSAISVSPVSLMSGTSSSSNVVTLTGPAPAAGAIVTLTSSTPSVSVPATVTVPAGATSANFTSIAANVSTNVSATITALYDGVSRSGSVSVTAATSNGTPLSSVAANPATVTGGNSSTGNKVWLAAAAPAGGTVVTLSSSSPAATVPATVTVPAGLTYANFTISTSVVTANTSVTITATSGATSKTTVVTVLPAAASSLFLRSVRGGGTSWDNLVYLTGPAPAGGAVVSITASAGVVVPATVTVPAGATSVKFPITSSAVSANTTYTISATFGGATKSGVLTITP